MNSSVKNASIPIEAPVADLLGELNDVERKNAPERLYFLGDRELFRASPRTQS